jgi:gag-polyprotein putative aspartyl protease
LSLIVTLTADELLRNGPIVKIRIGNPSDPAKTATVTALVDTGAAFTAINPQLAQSCQLIQRGQKKIRVLGNTKLQDAREYPEFAASISFPGSDLRDFRAHGVVACQIFETQFSCLIGRDLLKYWELTYSGTLGQFSIRDPRNEVSGLE